MLGALAFAACNDRFLEVAPEVALSEEKLFADPVRAAEFADNAYSFIPDDYLRFNGNNGLSQATDEAVGSSVNEQLLYTINKGLFLNHAEITSHTLNDIGGVYNNCYGGIRVVNKLLARHSGVPWTPAQDAQRIKGEMHYLRALFYAELVKRFGGVVIIDRDYLPTDDIDFARSPYADCVAFILSDLEQAIALLPAEYDAANYGRPTLGAARALKARVLLYDASPLNNPSGEAGRWSAAARAAKDVMDMNRYRLHERYDELLSPPGNGTIDEYILIKVRGPRTWNWIIQGIASPGSGGRQGVFNPTQNHVDRYEMANGLPITHPESGYDETEPYANRDPRFYANILYNDAPWQGRRMQLWNGGTDYIQGNSAYSVTGYYARKLWPEVYRSPGQQLAILNYVYYRYGEILLNYAEAQNEAAGPDQSVYDAVNAIRSRANMPGLPEGLTKDAMRERIHNERAVELAFEDQRWFDILRWNRGPEIVAQTVYGMDVERRADGSFAYSRRELPGQYQRVFEPHMHRYPFPRIELQKSLNLEQNPGWQ